MLEISCFPLLYFYLINRHILKSEYKKCLISALHNAQHSNLSHITWNMIKECKRQRLFSLVMNVLHIELQSVMLTLLKVCVMHTQMWKIQAEFPLFMPFFQSVTQLTEYHAWFPFSCHDMIQITQKQNLITVQCFFFHLWATEYDYKGISEGHLTHVGLRQKYT